MNCTIPTFPFHKIRLSSKPNSGWACTFHWTFCLHNETFNTLYTLPRAILLQIQTTKEWPTYERQVIVVIRACWRDYRQLPELTFLVLQCTQSSDEESTRKISAKLVARGLPASTALCCQWRHVKWEKCLRPFRGKAELERPSNFENL